MDPQVLEEDPKTISVSLHKVILEHLTTYPLAPDETELTIKVDGDGAPVMPRVNQTCIAVKADVDRYCQFLKDHAGVFIKVKKEVKKQGANKKVKTPNVIGREIESIVKIHELLMKEALEHLHWLRKKDYRDLSNKGEKAMAQLMKTEWSRAKIKKKVLSRETSKNKKRRADAAAASKQTE
eukprot:gene4793-5860_t